MSKQSWKSGNMLYPVPAVMVSCMREHEKANIITIAWAGTVCSDPAMVSISVRPERYSHGIISDTKEFVINLVNEDLVRACDWCGVMSGGVGYTLQMVAQGFTDPTVASLLMSLEAVFAALTGAVLLGERMTLRELTGCVIMFAAIVLVQLPAPKRKSVE